MSSRLKSRAARWLPRLADPVGWAAIVVGLALLYVSDAFAGFMLGAGVVRLLDHASRRRDEWRTQMGHAREAIYGAYVELWQRKLQPDVPLDRATMAGKLMNALQHDFKLLNAGDAGEVALKYVQGTLDERVLLRLASGITSQLGDAAPAESHWDDEMRDQWTGTPPA